MNPRVGPKDPERYGNFFQGLIDTLREKHRFTNARKGQPQNWYSFSSGYSYITYGANFTGQREARVEVYIDYPEADRNIGFLEELRQHQDEVQSQLGNLDWQRLENRRACRIALTRPGSIDNDDDVLADIQEWMTTNLLKFKQEFDPLLAQLTR